MVTVYEHPLSPYAQKVKIALREKAVAFDLVLPSGFGADAPGDAFAALSPRGEVPVLVDGETAVFDSTIILEYIEDRWPSPPLLPAAPAERARVRLLEEVMDTHFEAVNWAMGELNWFRRASGALEQTLRAEAARQTAGFHAWLDKQLGDRTWFNGEAFGWGDLSVAPYVAGAINVGHPPPDGSRLAAWFARAAERPSVAQTLAESAGFRIEDVGLPEAIAAGLFKREYRDHRLEWMIRSGGAEVVMQGLAAGNIRFGPEFG